MGLDNPFWQGRGKTKSPANSACKKTEFSTWVVPPGLPGILPTATEGGKATRESNFCKRSSLLVSLPQKGKVRQQMLQFKNLHLKA